MLVVHAASRRCTLQQKPQHAAQQRRAPLERLLTISCLPAAYASIDHRMRNIPEQRPAHAGQAGTQRVAVWEALEDEAAIHPQGLCVDVHSV